MRVSRRGVALPFVLLVSLILIAFVSAMLVRVTQTLRFTTFDEAQVQARMLADSGARLALVLMRDYQTEWYVGRLPVTSRSLGFPDDRGTFEIDVLERAQLGGDPFPPQGTWRTIVCTGRSGNRTARTIVTAKVTSPLLNYLSLVRGDLGLGYDLATTRRVTGPILTVPNPELNQRGDVHLFHAAQFFDYATNKFSVQTGTLELASEIKASGGIYLRNLNQEPVPVWNGDLPRYTRDAMQVDGTIPRGTLAFSSPDINVQCSDPWGGSIVLTDDLKAEPNHAFSARIPGMQKVLDKLKQAENRKEIDVSAYPEGVLVEFFGGKVFVSQVAYRDVGRVFDHDMALSTRNDQFVAELHHQYPADTIPQIFARLNREVAWDDPLFPNAPYPNSPRDLDGDGVKEAVDGDYFNVRRIVRGPRIDTIPISRSQWTVLIFRTSNVTYADADGTLATPPLFLRGKVTGKAVVVHDVTSSDLDPSCSKVQTLILAEHEAPNDAPGNQVASAPGVPGGITYQNRRIKDRPDATGTFTQDALVVVSRGQLHAVGQPGWYVERVRRGASLYDYRAALMNRDREFSQAYGGAPDNPDFQLMTAVTAFYDNAIRAPFYGIAVEQTGGPFLRLTSDARIVQGFSSTVYPHSGSPLRWRDMNGPPPPLGCTDDDVPCFPRRLRNATVPDGYKYRLSGGVHGLGSAPSFHGECRYDYRFQELEASEIEHELGLPVSIITASWSRR